MKCVICGNEKSIFSVLGLEGSICRRCNEHLNMYTYDSPTIAKAYFDKVSETSELTPDAKRFLELKYREHQSEISEFETHNSYDCSLEYKAFHRELANIEKKLEDQYNSVRTIKTILIFFAVLTGIGLVGTFIYVAQIISALNKVF